MKPKTLLLALAVTLLTACYPPNLPTKEDIPTAEEIAKATAYEILLTRARATLHSACLDIMKSSLNRTTEQKAQHFQCRHWRYLSGFPMDSDHLPDPDFPWWPHTPDASRPEERQTR